MVLRRLKSRRRQKRRIGRGMQPVPGAGFSCNTETTKGVWLFRAITALPEVWDYHSHVFYSDDHGETWQLGGSVPDNTTSECQVVELADGTLLLSIRYHAWVNQAEGPHYRTVAFSRDGGETWGDVRKDRGLIDPRCQASVFRHTRGNAILFSNPANTARDRMTVRASFDEGETWGASKMLHAGAISLFLSNGFCRITVSAVSMSVGRSIPARRLRLRRFTLEWLSDA